MSNVIDCLTDKISFRFVVFTVVRYSGKLIQVCVMGTAVCYGYSGVLWVPPQ